MSLLLIHDQNVLILNTRISSKKKSAYRLIVVAGIFVFVIVILYVFEQVSNTPWCTAVLEF